MSEIYHDQRLEVLTTVLAEIGRAVSRGEPIERFRSFIQEGLRVRFQTVDLDAYSSRQPRVPAGSSRGGQWAGKRGVGASAPIPAAHDPASHEAALKERYGDAASTVAWGKAMHARGRDLPLGDFRERLSDLRNAGVGVVDVRKQQVAREMLQDRRIKTAGQMVDAMRKRAKETGSRTLAAYADKVELSAKLAAHHQALEGKRVGKIAFADRVGRFDGAKISRKQATDVRDKASDFYGAMSHKRLEQPTDMRWVIDASPRASYQPKKNQLNLGAGRERNDHYSVALHEWAHAIEHRNPARLAKSVAYLNARAKGEKPVTMNELTGSTRYKDAEVATPDKLYSPYMGKRYTGDRATEVTAIAVQHMTKIDHATKLHKRDPDSIDFLLGQLANR